MFDAPYRSSTAAWTTISNPRVEMSRTIGAAFVSSRSTTAWNNSATSTAAAMPPRIARPIGHEFVVRSS